jgi:hypothetical protein
MSDAHGTAPVRLVIPSGTTNPEYETVQRELNAMFPDLAFTVMGAADDVTATDMVVRGEADLSETNSAGIVAKYVSWIHVFSHLYAALGIK